MAQGAKGWVDGIEHQAQAAETVPGGALVRGRLLQHSAVDLHGATVVPSPCLC